MTNLSKYLCKICGIEPKCINCGQTVSSENPCSKPCNKQKYPDFEKTENFVKLLNSPAETIIKNELLIRLIVILENKNKIYSDEFVNRIKQVIRETEWIYE